MMQFKSHLPLIALATVSALVIFYLYRELQKAKRALVTERPEECTSALCKEQTTQPAKRVRFEGDPGSRDSSAATAVAATPAPGVKHKAARQPEAKGPAASGATQTDSAFDSKE